MVNVSNVMMGLAFTFIAFIILVFVLSLGGSLTAELGEQQCEQAGGTYSNGDCSLDTSIAYNATVEGLDAIDTASQFMGTIVLAVIIGAVIAVLMVAIGGALAGGRERA